MKLKEMRTELGLTTDTFYSGLNQAPSTPDFRLARSPKEGGKGCAIFSSEPRQLTEHRRDPQDPLKT